MYFVVYFIDTGEYDVIHKTNIKDLNFECIVNNVINSSRTFQCYIGDAGNNGLLTEQISHIKLVKYFGMKKKTVILFD